MTPARSALTHVCTQAEAEGAHRLVQTEVRLHQAERASSVRDILTSEHDQRETLKDDRATRSTLLAEQNPRGNCCLTLLRGVESCAPERARETLRTSLS